jgi:fatty acid desaturase
MAADASRPSVEWRTVAVAVAVHGLWLAAVALHASTPWPLTVVALAVATAWHGSLQHETIHGHPFRSRRLNSLVGSLPISVRLPYPVYRRYHLAHHDCADLTDPTDDSESFYVSVEQWESKGRLGRAFLLAHHTLLGRLVLGPPRDVARLFAHQAREIWRGDRELARWWAAHMVAAAALVAFVAAVMGVPLWQYLLGATYLGNSLTLMRSYCEHRWVEGATRSAVVRSGRFFSMLYLYNNLHHVHHADPGVPWYRLSAHADATGGYEEAAAGAGLYRGYFELARRFLLRPFDHPVHPAERTALTSNL